MIAALVAALLALSPAPPQPEPEARLIAWAIEDFRAHLPGPARGFRAVHPASLEHLDGQSRPVLCGEVQVERPGGATDWIRFATLETSSGYEQWLGGAAAAWCNDATRLDRDRDLSERLAQRVVP